MKMTIGLPFLLAAALGLAAQQPEADDVVRVQASGPSAKSRVKDPREAAPAENGEKKTPPSRKQEQAGNGAGQEADEGGVMIDARADEDSAYRPERAGPRPAAETDEANVSGGMPASYGQLKGAFNEGGRSFLVFENEDGIISFVQISVGRNSVGLKFVSRIRRTGD